MNRSEYPFLKRAMELNYRSKYYNQAMTACNRGILFQMSFEEWLKFWKDSGHLHERGNEGKQYVMARNKDRGPYKLGNVRIITKSENSKETWINKRNQILDRPKRKNKG